jgi:peptidyl-prolyl cis-trans isomerase SurA
MKRMNKLVLFFFATLLSVSAMAQNEDPVLFSVGGKSVNLSEFKYIYQKTNGDKADFSKQSVEEYLDLYIKFKRKVARARDMKLDTIASLQQELAGYRQQLANSYLVDKEVSDRLVKEAYDRMAKDIEISHILIKIERSAVGKDTVEAYNKALAIKKRLDAGEDFAKVARELSQDPSVKENDGKLGFITAMLPTGFYELESAAYNTPIGKNSAPVRSDMGYHVIRPTNVRDARGEVEVAHILIRTKDRAITAKLKIDSIYTQLKAGGNFEEMAAKLSEDRATASRGGVIGFFGINRYEIAFENGSFGLDKDGAYSAPFETSVGWHIVKRLSRKGLQAFDTEKRRLKAKIQRDSRYDIANVSFINRIKAEGAIQENEKNLADYIATQSDTLFTTYRWKMPETRSDKPLLSFKSKQTFTLGDFMDHVNNNSRKRLGFPSGTSANDAARSLYTDFVRDCCLKYEEAQLETKYPEFKSLMREYEEGILLFEAMKREVWDKASQDSVGLVAFQKTQIDKYKWDERAEVNLYSLKEEAKDQIETLRTLAAKKDYAKVLKKMNDKTEIVTVQPFKLERGKNKSLDALGTWIKGALSATENDTRSKTLTFYKIEKTIPPTVKTLAEARGYVVADYQEFLEKKWLSDLEKNYNVQTNKSALDVLIKK